MLSLWPLPSPILYLGHDHIIFASENRGKWGGVPEGQERFAQVHCKKLMLIHGDSCNIT